ncbi:MAG: hypothetical protein V3U54_07740 [Thermodesulfobacteriota bacterium]
MSDCKCSEQIARLRIRLRILERYMAELMLKRDRQQLRDGVPDEYKEWPLDSCEDCHHIRQEHAYNLYHCQRRKDDERCKCNEFIFQEVPAE